MKEKNPCDDCKNKQEDDYGLICDLGCGCHSMYWNYSAGYKEGIEEVVDWLENNFEPTIPMTLDYKKWHKQLENWGVK
jgi:hypothetical protein